MHRNLSEKEAVIRALVAVAIAIVGSYYQRWWALLGLIPLLSAATEWCPVYRIIGFSTRE